MSKLFLLFSHQFTERQKEDAEKNLKVSEIINLPTDLQKRWSNVPPELDSIKLYLLPIRKWISKLAKRNDYLLVQGEFGAVYLIVEWAKRNELIPVYATTIRKVREKREGEKIKTEKEFQHKRFRKYEKWK